jgi:dTDP-4-amino-4,6-dideoxy-D-galactose acyltransferase
MQELLTNVCEHLSWDSDFFGCRIARVLPSRLSPEIAARVETWCNTNRIDCLYYLADADDEQTIRLAQAHRFGLVDVRLTLSRKLSELDTKAAPCAAAAIRPAVQEDLPALRAIARQSHRDSRFYFDLNFPREKCDAFYELWIEKSCRGFADAVLVAERESRAVGYITCKSCEPSTGQIGLLAVDAASVGLGLGSALITSALDWFRERVHQQVLVVTQGRNIRAQRSYQRAGFLSESLRLSYHRWFWCNRQVEPAV